ncbi:MAG: hypothetical protein RR280_01245 [Bacteroidaceae bacterium]
METKSDKVRNLVKAGQYKEALAIVKTFKLGLKKADRDTLVRAHEAQWNPAFYIKMGKNPEELFAQAVVILKAHYAG